jgi:hypothetical protein
MQDPDLNSLLAKARQAQDRLDWSAREYGFENRLTARLQAMDTSGLGTLSLLWRAVAGCAALTGMLCVWFILAQTPQETEDDLTAFWDSGQASYDGEFVN